MITLGYEKFINGNPTTNGFDCGEESSPINLGWAGYKSDHNTRDSELGKSTQKRCYAYHFSTLRQFFDIRIQDISTIKRKYYYVIDVFDHDFWINPNARYPNIDPLAVKDIKNGKAKVLVLFTSESLKDNYDISGILNSNIISIMRKLRKQIVQCYTIFAKKLNVLNSLMSALTVNHSCLAVAYPRCVTPLY